MLKKKNWILAILLVITLVTLNVFNLTPVTSIVTVLLLGFSTIGHFLVLREPKLFSKEVKFWYYIGLGLMLTSLCTCYLYYGQSFVSGFVANFNFYKVGGVMLFAYLFKKNSISIPNLFSLLTKVGWVLLALTAIMAITNFVFINESELTGKIVEVTAAKLSKTFINFIAIYWFSKYLFQNKYKFLVYSLLFFSANHFLEIQRFALLVSFLIISIGIFKRRESKATLKFIFPAFSALLFIGMFLFNSVEGSALINRFSEAAKVFTEDANDINDASSAVRIYETEFALDKFKQRPLFGNGYYRASEVENIIGEGIYFYPSDIGLFGVLYTLGSLGIVVFFMQLKLVWVNYKMKHLNHYNFSIVLYLIFIMLFSLTTGKSVNNFHLFLFFVCLLQITNGKIRVRKRIKI